MPTITNRHTRPILSKHTQQQQTLKILQNNQRQYNTRQANRTNKEPAEIKHSPRHKQTFQSSRRNSQPIIQRQKQVPRRIQNNQRTPQRSRQQRHTQTRQRKYQLRTNQTRLPQLPKRLPPNQRSQKDLTSTTQNTRKLQHNRPQPIP